MHQPGQTTTSQPCLEDEERLERYNLRDEGPSYKEWRSRCQTVSRREHVRTAPHL